MIVRFLTGPGIPGTIWPVGIHSTWDEAIGAVTALGGFVMTVNGKREKEIVGKVWLCSCDELAQRNSWLCEQCNNSFMKER